MRPRALRAPGPPLGRTTRALSPTLALPAAAPGAHPVAAPAARPPATLVAGPGTGKDEGSPINLPNAMTLAGIVCSTIWLAGGSGWFALAGLLLDELDGRVARATGQTTALGSQLDWAGDVALNAAVLAKLGAPYVYALPPIVVGQAALREEGWRPPVGSARALVTLFALWKAKFFRFR